VNNLFARNRAGSNNGDALLLLNAGAGSRADVIFTTIASPTVSGGRAIAVFNGTVNITNTIIASHTVGISRTAGTVTQNYNLFSGNTSNTGGTVGGGVNSLTAAPRFVNPAGDDYHISSSSAAFEAGTDMGITEDFDVDPRPRGTQVDMGFDETAPPPSVCFATLDGTQVYSTYNAAAVQQAVDAASAGGSVMVAGICAGVQARGGTTQTVVITKALTLMGGFTITNWLTPDGASNMTVLDAQAGGRVISATQPVTINSLTIQNGKATGTSGGGAAFTAAATILNSTFYSNTSSAGGGVNFAGPATISNTVFISNVVSSGPGGGALFLSTAFVTNTRFTANTAITGGGLALSNTTGFSLIANSVFASNRATTNSGDAMYLFPSGTGRAVIVHTTIASPTVSSGQAIAVGAGTVNITNTIIASHTVGINRVGGTVTQNFNLFSGNTNNTQGTITSGANSFMGPAVFQNPALNDYHIITGSAAINKGTNVGVSFDFDNLPRPKGAGYDIGAFEFNNNSPVADAGMTQTIMVGTLVTLTGAASSDPDNDPLIYRWTQISGSAATLSSATDVTPTFVAPRPDGTLVFRLVVTDVIGQASAPAFVTITVTNTEPIADAGTPQTVIAGAVVTLTGVASTDPDGHALTFDWYQVGGVPVTLSDTNAISPTFTAPGVTGDLIFLLYVIDAYWALSAPAFVTVTVANNAPVANAGAPQTTTAGSLVSLTGIASSDADGHALTFGWAQISGAPVTLANANDITATFTAPGTLGDLVFRLVVTDAYGAVSMPALVTVTVENSKPTADAGAQQSVNGHTVVSLTGSASSDPNGQPLTFGWTQTNGMPVTLTSATAISPTFTAPAITDTLVFQLVVTDSLGLASDPAFVTVTVSNSVPLADAGTPQTVIVGSLVTLTGSASSDPDDDALAYGWTQVNGEPVTLTDAGDVTPTFTAPAITGTLVFHLVVTDVYGVRSTPAVVTVTVINNAPVADAGAPFTATVGANVSLAGGGSSDPDGHALTFGWTQVSGDAVVLSNGNAVTPTFTAPGVTGALVFQLVVTDAFGAVSTPAFVTVTVTNGQPVASAIAPATATVGSLVTLGGGLSDDPEGHALTHGWTQISGTAVTLSSETAISPTFTAPSVTGDLVFQLVVTDAFGAVSAPAVVTVTVTNGQPVASATAPVTATVGSLVTLGGGLSNDPEDHALSYGWTQISGADVTLSSENEISPTFTAGVTGGFIFQLVVTDAYGAVSAPAFVTITVTNDTPVADAGVPQSVGVGTLVTLTGIASSDLNGHALAHSWTQMSGEVVTLSSNSTISPAFTAPGNAGTLVFQLVVTDAYGAVSAPALVTITVTNDAPVANAGIAQTATVNTDVTLDGSPSSDPDGHALTYGWSQISGVAVLLSSSSAISPAFTAPLITGTLVFQLVVTDAYGMASAPAMVAITITNGEPTAIAGTPQTVIAGTPVTLTGAASSDPEGHALLAYGWLQTSGAPVLLSSNSAVSPTFTAPGVTGNLVFQLVVTDIYGAMSAPAFVTITVINGRPVANAGLPKSVVVNTPVTLNGNASSDPDGHALTFGWLQVSGLPVLLSSNSALSPTFIAPATTGVLVFQLIVTDAFGAVSTPSVVTITVTNGEPVANAGAPQTVFVNASVTLNGSASSDPEAQALTYEWAQVSGTPVLLSSNSAALPTFTAPNSIGALVFQLVVTDSAGLASQPAFVTVTVEASPVTVVPPSGLTITVTTGNAVLQTSVEFTYTLGAGSEPVTFTWDFGDGSPAVTGPTASHVYAPGTYTATVTATNSAGTITTIVRIFVPWRVLLPIIALESAPALWQQRRE
jgi:hypothetical protein